MQELVEEWLARDLKSLVGCKATLLHVGTRKHLVELVQAKYPEVTDSRDLAVLIVKELRDAVGSLPPMEAEAARYLLGLSASGTSAFWRRVDAIRCLGGGFAVDTFRREPELEFMRSVARALM